MSKESMTWLASLALVALLAGCNSGIGSRAQALASADTASLIKLTEALEIAQKEVPDGMPVEVALEIEDDDEDEPPAYEVVFFVGGSNTLIEVEIDARSGKVLEVEVEDDAEDDD